MLQEQYRSSLSATSQRMSTIRSLLLGFAFTVFSGDPRIGILCGMLLFCGRMIGADLGQRWRLSRTKSKILLVFSALSLYLFFFVICFTDLESISPKVIFASLVLSFMLSGLFKTWSDFGERWHFGAKEIQAERLAFEKRRKR